MIRAIVIDDEAAGVETIRILANRQPDRIKIVDSALKPGDGIKLIEDYHPDVVFLDIQMSEMTGFQLLERLSYRKFHLVFTTAYNEHALKAIKCGAFDYLLKPLAEADFEQCLNKLDEAGVITNDHHLSERGLILDIPVKDGIIYLKQSDIVRMEAERSYTNIYMDNGIRYVASKSMGELEPRLHSGMFYRCHKSHIVNLGKVVKFVNHDGCYALMSDGAKPDISRFLKEQFLERMKELRH